MIHHHTKASERVNALAKRKVDYKKNELPSFLEKSLMTKKENWRGLSG